MSAIREYQPNRIDAGQIAGVERSRIYLRVAEAFDSFEQLLLNLELADIAGKRELVDKLQQEIAGSFDNLSIQLEMIAGRNSPLSENTRKEIVELARTRYLPYIMKTGLAKRALEKPLGYAGDYLTIELFYRNEPAGEGIVGNTLDRCFLDLPACNAVRNRRRLLSRQIERSLELTTPGSTTRVTSLACGPAREVFDFFEKTPEKHSLEFTLLDMDPRALRFAKHEAAKRNLQDSIRTVRGNLLRLSLGKETLEIAAQHLVYSIGLIDYFEDEMVVELLNWIHGILKPGGRVILGNFHPDNPTRAMMEEILDWKLVHRDQRKMDQLFMASRFQAPCSVIHFEEEGINLFAEATRSRKDIA
ncbi:MAG: class I SAM-dependent methyltransferase family protein [Candidatus Krumholzibacteria bacterium]|jgi:SAM-dependent methyltransferase|nr:class I SAM-dependent methyltransferase family protein [Candidatus Krumholzibacteria bacterium]